MSIEFYPARHKRSSKRVHRPHARSTPIAWWVSGGGVTRRGTIRVRHPVRAWSAIEAVIRDCGRAGQEIRAGIACHQTGHRETRVYTISTDPPLKFRIAR